MSASNPTAGSITTAPKPVRARTVRPLVRRLGQDYALVLPGLFISLFAFVVLVVMFEIAVATLVIWVGAFPLLVATWFAELSRTRVRNWGMDAPSPTYRAPGPGLRGLLRLLGDGQRYLDLVFKTLLALPLRIFTFTVAIVWTALIPAGILYHIPRCRVDRRNSRQLRGLRRIRPRSAGDRRIRVDRAVFTPGT